MKIAVVTSGFLPVPASKGGAVENLIVNILNQNEKTNNLEITVLSCFDEKAQELSLQYKKSCFKFYKNNILIDFLDNLTFFVAKRILKKHNCQSYRYIFKRLNYLNNVSKELYKNNYDKILLENHPTQYLALKWRKNYIKYADRYYYHCHNEFPGFYGCKKIINKTHKFICVSNFIAKSLMSYTGLTEDKFIVLRNCVDLKRFNSNISYEEKKELKDKYNIKDEKVLLFTGRLTQEKGIKELIDSLISIKNEKFKLLAVGSSLNDMNVKTNFENELEKSIAEIKEKVIFTGFIKYEEINKLYSIADIAVLPSIWNDPAPLTIIESLAAGLPIITTNSGGIPEYANNKCAIILNRDDKIVDNLSQAINKLINDDMLLKEMSIESKKASVDLTLENYYFNFKKIIEGE